MRRSGAPAIGLLLLVLVAGCTAGVGPLATPTPGEAVRATVTGVVDGDTVEVRLADGGTDTVRLLGVDTPEVHGENEPGEYEGVPDTEAGAACLRDAGEAASAFVRQRLRGASVRLVFDPAADRRGRYGRLLAYVHHEGTDLNRRLVATGHARVYDNAFSRASRYHDLEGDAQAAGRGLWACREPGGTATPTDGPLRVAAVHADAAGDDRDHLADEYVVLEHVGTATLELGGWTLVDAAGHRYRFPSGFELAPGERVTVHTGAGTDTATDLYWGADGPVWNNGGDTVTVRADDGTVVLNVSYG